jgi:hypothetical protein
VTRDNEQQVVQHVRKHRGYEQVNEEWLEDHIRPDAGTSSESTTETQ